MHNVTRHPMCPSDCGGRRGPKPCCNHRGHETIYPEPNIGKLIKKESNLKAFGRIANQLRFQEVHLDENEEPDKGLAHAFSLQGSMDLFTNSRYRGLL
jgi:hypothetical protein